MQYTYEEAVDFFKKMPHFVPPKNNVSGKNFFSLDAELALLEKLDMPQKKLKYVHVAGTNGKGSTCAYLASILKEASVVTGAFTSPFLKRYNEMFKVNGVDISDEDFAEIFSVVKPEYDKVLEEGYYPSEYEFLTVMAFMYFLKMKCEIVIMEVSLGGRMDTTNVIPAPLVSVITPISYDHITILGNTLTEIATEKAGIIKPGTRVISAPQELEVVDVLKNECGLKNVSIDFISSGTIINRNISGQTFKLSNGGEYFTKLLGIYQIDNAAVAIAAAEKLKEMGYQLTEASIKAGVAQAEWYGRFTLLSDTPPVIIDGGHNRQGALVLRESLEEYFPGKKVTFIIGILADKEVDIILDTLMPIAEKCYTLAVPNGRTLPPDELAKRIRSRGVNAQLLTEDMGLEKIKKEAEVICITGSLYLTNGKNFT